MNIKNAERELEIAIIGLTESDQDDPSSTHIDEALLHRIIVAESARVYLTKQSRAPKGIFDSYDQLCELLASIISGIDPKYKWPKALAMVCRWQRSRHSLSLSAVLSRRADCRIGRVEAGAGACAA